ncbi:MAG TPA: hypothetical protein VMF89_01445, partial [Polyangiales bacterium]|nr:hypothetical protein [Polyangiales bacterium]
EMGIWQMGSFSEALGVAQLTGSARTLDLGHASSYVLDLQDRALVIGSDRWNLHFSVLLGERIAASYVLRDAVRDFSAYLEPAFWPSQGDGHDVLVELETRESAAGVVSLSFLPLHVPSGQPAVEAGSILTFDAVRSQREDDRLGRDVASLGESIISLRANNRVVVAHLAAPSQLLQNITLPP